MGTTLKAGAFVLAAALALAGCGGGSGDPDACLDAGLYGDGTCDLDCPNHDPDCDAASGDPCVNPNRYGDGTCDLDCDNPDPDCGGGGTDPCADPNRYGDGTCDLDCDNPDPDCGGGGTDPCADPNRYGDGTCDLDCWVHDGDCDVPPPGEIALSLPIASPNPIQAGCGAAVDFGVQVFPTESVTVDAVEVDVTDVGGTTVALADQGAASWSGAFVIPNVVPSGAYDLTITAHGTDTQAGGVAVTATATVHLVVEQRAGLFLDPNEVADPFAVLGGVATEVLFPARLTVNCAALDTLTVDLSSLGGVAGAPLYDDGTHGDVAAGDGYYVTTWTVPGAAANGVYVLPVTATGTVDGTLPVSATTSVALRIRGRLTLEAAAFLEGTVTWSPTADTLPAIFTEAGVERQVTAQVAAWADHGATLSSVTIDLSSLSGASDAPMYDDGPASSGGHEPDGATAGDGIFHRAFTIPAGQAAAEIHPTIRATAADPGGDLDAYRDTVVLVHDTGYTVVAQTGLPLDSITDTGALLAMSSDRGVYAFPSPYRFPFYGADYGALTLYSSGFARLGDVMAYTQPYEGDALSYARMGLAPMIAVCQSHDLSNSDYEVWYDEQGTEPDRSFVFEWRSTLGFSGFIEAQLILDEATGSITIHYGTMNDTAAASIYYYRWASLLVNGLTEFDQLFGWAEAPPLDAAMSNRRWIFTRR